MVEGSDGDLDESGAGLSRQDVVSPLRVSRQHAAIVGALIEARTAAHNLKGKPLARLPAFGRKLSAAATRRRKPGARIVLWTVRRAEALEGFHYLALFNHPDVPDSFLAAEERPAVREVTLVLATVLLARKGAKKLDRAAIKRRLHIWHYPATSDQDPDSSDERWIRRLKRRASQEDALRATPLRPIPVFLLGLLAPPKISR